MTRPRPVPCEISMKPLGIATRHMSAKIDTKQDSVTSLAWYKIPQLFA
ncbi:hypothetical protein [Photobacterium sanguinicancri]|nr:hypothetical protein [Photobacterium sanguinicancri]